MKVGIIGAGNVGKVLAAHLQKLTHSVLIANSRGPETLSSVAEETGATAVLLPDITTGVDLLVISIPLKATTALPQELFRQTPERVPIVDTGNYYPARDGVIEAIKGGLPESEWTSRVIQQPVIKAFNNITAHSINYAGLPKSSASRIALPVSGEDNQAKQMIIALMDDIGFDGIDAGSLSESWRQQPGTPAYCTDYGIEQLRAALANANRELAPQIRDAAYQQLTSLPPDTPPQEIVRLAREQWEKHPKA